MLYKILTAVGVTILVIQVYGQKDAVNSPSFKEYVNINGTEFYINTFLGAFRDDAKADCEAKNMSLISFNVSGKWESTQSWLTQNGYQWKWFWTSGIRFQGSSAWIWESTGQTISEFFWGAAQPDLIPGLLNTCVDFRVINGGWDDDDCSNFLLGYICEQ